MTQERESWRLPRPHAEVVDLAIGALAPVGAAEYVQDRVVDEAGLVADLYTNTKGVVTQWIVGK